MIFCISFINLLLCAFCYASHEENPIPRMASYDILACSIGKTKIEIGLFMHSGDQLKLIEILSKNTAELPTQEALESYIAGSVQQIRDEWNVHIEYGMCAVSGPKIPGNTWIQSSHMQYPVDGDRIAVRAKLIKMLVLNDFVAAGHAVPHLTEQQIAILYPGNPQPNEAKGLIGVSNGLGNCVITCHEGKHTVLPTGLNTIAYCPSEAWEFEFKKFLEQQQSADQPYIGWGTALGSKGGLVALWKCFFGRESTVTIEEIFAKGQSVEPDNQSYRTARNFYMQLYARAIRTFMLFTFPYGGLYITGRVAQEHPELIRSLDFIKNILTSGNEELDAMLRIMPLYLITHEALTLQGAAYALLQFLHKKNQLNDSN